MVNRTIKFFNYFNFNDFDFLTQSGMVTKLECFQPTITKPTERPGHRQKSHRPKDFNFGQQPVVVAHGQLYQHLDPVRLAKQSHKRKVLLD